MFALGGQAFTRRLSADLGLSYNEAEVRKIRHPEGATASPSPAPLVTRQIVPVNRISSTSNIPALAYGGCLHATGLRCGRARSRGGRRSPAHGARRAGYLSADGVPTPAGRQTLRQSRRADSAYAQCDQAASREDSGDESVQTRPTDHFTPGAGPPTLSPSMLSPLGIRRPLGRYRALRAADTHAGALCADFMASSPSTHRADPPRPRSASQLTSQWSSLDTARGTHKACCMFSDQSVIGVLELSRAHSATSPERHRSAGEHPDAPRNRDDGRGCRVRHLGLPLRGRPDRLDRKARLEAAGRAEETAVACLPLRAPSQLSPAAMGRNSKPSG